MMKRMLATSMLAIMLTNSVSIQEATAKSNTSSQLGAGTTRPVTQQLASKTIIRKDLRTAQFFVPNYYGYIKHG